MNALKPSFMKKKKTITPQKPSSFKDDATTSSSTSLNSSIRSTSSSMRGYDEMQCLKKISSFCKETDRDVSTHLMFRIACFHDFDFDRSKHTIITMSDSKYLGLHMEGPLSKHFGKRIVVPLPDLKARDKSNVVYLRPSRYSGTKNSQLMVDSLCYVLNDLSSTQSQCRAGVTVVVNMKKWARDNFDQEMWVKMIRILQGDLVPTKVMNVLLVDAPEEFRNVWELLEQLMPNTFYKKVNFVKQNKLGDYFKDGFHEHLPNEFKRGWLSIDEVVEDYIDLKQYNDQLVDL
ncbi:unnamed protein product [Cylindrotheca closterium]|uniref:CRAL-TRIO domain-containing protein n=1 Tax=Cylindrotheca closterium TaxID=2856 RepID=A0AAD2CTP2_9STRA|nr:unnamed protein product [Cylindrotheca closterium]